MIAHKKSMDIQKWKGKYTNDNQTTTIDIDFWIRMVTPANQW